MRATFARNEEELKKKKEKILKQQKKEHGGPCIQNARKHNWVEGKGNTGATQECGDY